MSAGARPLELQLTRHAEADLLRIPADFRQRIKADILRLAQGQIPFAQLKKLRSFTPPIWQLTSGRFRIFYRREGEQLLILRVVAKPDPQDLLRSLR
jgi:mRNA-degrading endonuclease RelE of RelBE toxin-antitoxin system